MNRAFTGRIRLVGSMLLLATLAAFTAPAKIAVGQVPLPTGMVETLTVAEYLQLPENAQAVFVGGLIEGMAFVMYGYSIPDYAKWSACVRSQSLGATAKDVVNFIHERPNFNESIASALAQTFGQRCKH